MSASVTDAVARALPQRVRETPQVEIDLTELHDELDRVAEEALCARQLGVPLPDAVRRPEFEALARFHQDLRDALFVEIPQELAGWVDAAQRPRTGQNDLGSALTDLAQKTGDTENAELQQALAELLVFEAVRLRLLVAALRSAEFERLGGEEADVDAIAWEEVRAMLEEPELTAAGVRPLQVMFASASVSLARDAARRVEDLQRSGSDVREQLLLRANLRAALRELRLPEAVLLENALSNLIGEDRVELRELQESRPLALEGLSRQAMDQRVSRGRRALTKPATAWPRRRRPALFDLLRDS